MDKNKKVILFMPSMDGGGVEKNLIIVANYLVNKSLNVILITYDTKFNSRFNNKIKILNVTKNKKEKHSKYFKYYKCLLILIKTCLSNSNFLVLSFQANIYCAILSKLFKYKLIIRSNSSPSGWSKNIIKNLIFRIFFKASKDIIVNSYEFKRELKIKFNLNSKVIYNPLNISEIVKKSKQKIKLKFFNQKRILKIINIARFTQQKDHITLLKALKLINNKINYRLLIIGYGPEKNNIQKFIKAGSLSKNVKLIGFQNNPYKYIKVSDLFVLSSLYEGLPNVILEAITLKKFVISSNCPTGPNEILMKGQFGMLFKTQNHIELSKKILEFNNNRNKYNRISEKSFKSLSRFDYKKNCEKYYQLILKSFD